jgi:integrase
MAVSEPIETLSGRHVQHWIDGLLHPATGEPLSVKTVRRKLASLRAYWDHLQSHEIVTVEQRPFADRKVNGGTTEAQDAEAARERFTTADVVKLWEAADAKGDVMLAAAIRIAAYTGMRREGICTLRANSIRRDPDSGIAFMHVAEKTAAGVRDVPIHSAIRDLLTGLGKKADRDGYLICAHHPLDAPPEDGSRCRVRC